MIYIQKQISLYKQLRATSIFLHEKHIPPWVNIIIRKGSSCEGGGLFCDGASTGLFWVPSETITIPHVAPCVNCRIFASWRAGPLRRHGSWVPAGTIISFLVSSLPSPPMWVAPVLIGAPLGLRHGSCLTPARALGHPIEEGCNTKDARTAMCESRSPLRMPTRSPRTTAGRREALCAYRPGVTGEHPRLAAEAAGRLHVRPHLHPRAARRRRHKLSGVNTFFGALASEVEIAPELAD